MHRFLLLLLFMLNGPTGAFTQKVTPAGNAVEINSDSLTSQNAVDAAVAGLKAKNRRFYRQVKLIMLMGLAFAFLLMWLRKGKGR